MKKENLPSRAWKHLQRHTPSNESLDGFAGFVGMWWALRRAEKGERKMIEACDRVTQADAAVAATKTGKEWSTSEGYLGATGETSTSASSSAKRVAADGNGVFKYVVLYALTLVLQPVLAVVLTLATLWGMWHVLLWVFMS